MSVPGKDPAFMMRHLRQIMIFLWGDKITNIKILSQGRPRLRFKDVAKINMKWKDIKEQDWLSNALDC